MIVDEKMEELDKVNKVNMAFLAMGIEDRVGPFTEACLIAHYDVDVAVLAITYFSEKLFVTGGALCDTWNIYMIALENLLDSVREHSSADNLIDVAKASLREVVGDDVINSRLLSDAHPLNLVKVRIWQW